MKRTSSTLPPFHCFPLAAGIIIFDKKNGKRKKGREKLGTSWSLLLNITFRMIPTEHKASCIIVIYLRCKVDVRKEGHQTMLKGKYLLGKTATRWKLFQWNFPFSASRIASHRRRYPKCVHVFGMANLAQRCWWRFVCSCLIFHVYYVKWFYWVCWQKGEQ